MEPTEEHLDPTAEINLETVKSRTVKGIVALTQQYFGVYIITIIAYFFLGKFLNPVLFGIFGVVSAIINFLVYFSDIGLAASLIQKKEKITQEDLKTTFTVQQILVITLILIVVAGTSFIRHFYNLDQSSVYLLYALCFSFFMSSLKSIPSVILERHLRFEVVAISAIIETLVYNLVLVFLAWKGFGITSFTISVIARGIIGVTVLYLFQPWKPTLQISRSSLKKLLVFGIPYQINTFIAVLKDDGLTIILGKVIGLGPLGILSWAQGWIQMPLRVVLDNVTRVTFPAFSRMQDNMKELKENVTRSIFFIAFLVFPAVVGIVILAPIVFQSISKFSQWLPAVIPLAFLAVNVIFAAVTTQLTNLLNAIGKIKITSGLMVMWTVLTWLLVPYLGLKYGVNGASAGYAIVGASSIIAIFIVKKYVDFSLTESTFKPLAASFIMGAVLLVLRNFLPVNLYSVFVLTVIGMVAYFASIFVFVGMSIIDDIRKVSGIILHKNENINK
ncbi:MAG: oligosaccharide flippase family protein [Candidatus Microgenomates bacterium]